MNLISIRSRWLSAANDWRYHVGHFSDERKPNDFRKALFHYQQALESLKRHA